MPSFLEALQTNPLLLAALLAGIATSVVSGIIGSYVVVKRIVFIGGSISHAVLSGIGFCIWLERTKGSPGFPLYTALLAAAILSALIDWMDPSSIIDSGKIRSLRPFGRLEWQLAFFLFRKHPALMSS